MRYTLLLHYPEPTAEELGPEALAEGMRAFQAYAKALDDAGVLASAEVLQQSDATTTVTLAGGELVVQDGPFADTKEQLGGTFVIEVAGPRRRDRVGEAGTIGVVGSRRDPTDRDPLRGRLVAGRTAGQVTDHEAGAAAERVPRGSRTAGSWRCSRRRHGTSRSPRTPSPTPSSGRCAPGRRPASPTTRRGGS